MFKEETNKLNSEWADQLRKADERSEFFRTQAADVMKRKEEIEGRLGYIEKQIGIREDEIQRLNNLYQGG